jgi:raffinose/stachyose/melibiose transport system substrate-binding protein
MKIGKSKGRLVATAATLFTLSASLMGCSTATSPTSAESTSASPSAEGTSDAPATITWLVDDGEQTLAAADATSAAFQAEYPNSTVELNKRIATDQNAVQTKLAAGTMEDVFTYNTGSLFQALNPAVTMTDLTNETFMNEVSSTFLPAVTVDGSVYGVPYGPMSGGGIMYNKKVYADLGLDVPTTWAQFMANNAKIKAAGLPAVIGSYGEGWTAQILILADFYNVNAAAPGFADQYTAGQANYQYTSAAQASFQKLADLYDGGYLQKNNTTTGFIDALTMLANGEAGHYPMSLFALAYMPQDKVQDIGVFAVPGQNAADNGMTVWLPNAVYLNSKSENQDAAKKFLGFLVSQAGTDAYTASQGYQGPYLTANQSAAPADVYPAVRDMESYFTAGKTVAALEFVSPLKGPNLPQIAVAVGTGQITAAEGAKQYDEDVRKQAQQLGLSGW